MSETTARTYIGHAVNILNTENLDPRDKALIFASLAQAEATLEAVELVKSGVPVSAGAASRNSRSHSATSRAGCRTADGSAAHRPCSESRIHGN